MLNHIGITLLGTLAAYLLGSIASAVLIAKMMRLPDPRMHGSNNPGSTNMLRLGGRRAGMMTLIADMTKGIIPVYCAKYFSFSPTSIAFIISASVLGHLFPIFFRFRGGKGVATFLGALFALNPLLGLSCLSTWLVVVTAFRYASLASLVTVFCATPYVWLITHDGSYTMANFALSLLIIYQHRTNIRSLMMHKEPKIK